ncbi:L-aspartate oxidase [Kaistia algarum]|uniref:L-aspartate oxidase n=1 Tax=Kaistia algarum TaxID=2083279 RepID=UPI000CE91099|nr:L-aspartate oxidase [Kaistia algarum]MCX5516592.1 L-aspartate oxidase [Kaistia algarum]PPE77728.1 L-aspartate oxidase [Kaistia algarum]
MDIDGLNGLPVIVGAGLAGLMTALCLAPAPAIVLSAGPLGDGTSSGWAQGGVAAAVGPDDAPELHLADTLLAGDGLCDKAAARHIIEAGPVTIERLAALGVRFDRNADGTLALGLEAAHGRRRIVHAAGDATGSEIMRAIVAAARMTTSIRVLEGAEARRLVMEDGRIAGIDVAMGERAFRIATNRVVMATGGIGGLFERSTNPRGSFGQGLAMAARAGAELCDLEFIQFHPTALDGTSRPMKLISEAVRGEGAVLVDEAGERFLAGEPGAELAPRDVVARAVWRHMSAGHTVFLDARRAPPSGFARRFPAIDALCRAEGFDPASQPIPIRPAAHYHMGGIRVDAEGRSSVQGLWAAGEVASTGLHGANRLASNSLLEAAAMAMNVAASMTGVAAVQHRGGGEISPIGAADPALVQPILSRGAGVVRDRGRMLAALDALAPFVTEGGPASDPAIVALMIVTSALAREESRGAHFRSDFPLHAPIAASSVTTLAAALASAALLPASPPLARSA